MASNCMPLGETMSSRDLDGGMGCWDPAGCPYRPRDIWADRSQAGLLNYLTSGPSPRRSTSQSALLAALCEPE